MFLYERATEKERIWDLLACPISCDINEVEVYFYYNVFSLILLCVCHFGH